jgi:hypothetical protein
MTKRSLIDRILAGLDAKIADLQRARQHLIDARAELERRRRPTAPPNGHASPTRRRPPAPPPAAVQP